MCVRGVEFAQIGLCIGPGAWLWQKSGSRLGGVHCPDVPGCAWMVLDVVAQKMLLSCFTCAVVSVVIQKMHLSCF